MNAPTANLPTTRPTTKIVVTKRGTGILIASDEDARVVLARIKDGTDLMIEVRRPRNVRFHRLFFKLLDLIVENTERFGNVDEALLAVKIATHEVDTYIDADTGQVYYIPRSIAFESMDQDRFRRLFNRALYVACDRWLLGLKFEELHTRIFELVDGPERSSLGRRAS